MAPLWHPSDTGLVRAWRGCGTGVAPLRHVTGAAAVCTLAHANELPGANELGRLGATPVGDGVEFRVWALRARTVDVRIDGQVTPLLPDTHGVFSATIRAAPGDDYRYVLDGATALPDPCSRSQPEGVRGRSRIVDTSAFAWTDNDGRG